VAEATARSEQVSWDQFRLGFHVFGGPFRLIFPGRAFSQGSKPTLSNWIIAAAIDGFCTCGSRRKKPGFRLMMEAHFAAPGERRVAAMG